MKLRIKFLWLKSYFAEAGGTYLFMCKVVASEYEKFEFHCCDMHNDRVDAMA